MALTYRAVKGSPLTSEEADENIQTLADQIDAIDIPEGVGISSITQAGNFITVHLSDATTQGPFKLPVATFLFRGVFDEVAYVRGDLFRFDDEDEDVAGLYIVLKAHTGVEPFDPDFQVGGEDAYARLLPAVKGDPGNSFSPSAVGLFAGRSAYNAEVKGFSYLSTDGDGVTSPAVVFFKNSNLSGDWSAAIPFEGPQGEQGEPGVDGDDGATGATGPAGAGVPAGGTAGQIIIKSVGGGSEWANEKKNLDDLLDVDASAPSAGQSLKWNASTLKWEAAGLSTGDFKDSVRAAITSNIALANEQTAGGVALVAGDSALVAGQTLPATNGIYDVVAGGAWTRRDDANTSAEVTSGMMVTVEEGTSAGHVFILKTPDPITLGTTGLTFQDLGSTQTSPVPFAIVTKAGAANTGLLSDAGKFLRLSHTAAATYTVPPNSSVPHPVGTEIWVMWWNTGKPTIVAGAGVSIVSPDGLVLPSRYSMGLLKKHAVNTWTFTFFSGNRLESLLAADLPAAGTAGRKRYVSDLAGGMEFTDDGAHWVGPPEVFVIPLSDETTALATTGTVATWRAPYKLKITSGIGIPRIMVNTVSSSGLPTVDINDGGASLLSTKLTIDVSEKTSKTAAAAAVLATATTLIADDAELTFDIDVTGTGTKGLKVAIYARRYI